MRNDIYRHAIATDQTLKLPVLPPMIEVGRTPAVLHAAKWINKEAEEMWVAGVDLALCYNPGLRLSVGEELIFPGAEIISDHHLELFKTAKKKTHLIIKYTANLRLRALTAFAFAFYDNAGLKHIIAATGKPEMTVVAPPEILSSYTDQQRALMKALQTRGIESPPVSFNGMMKGVFTWVMTRHSGEERAIQVAKSTLREQ